ncbi:hypothetical protein [Mycolicibacterium sp. XJ1819]
MDDLAENPDGHGMAVDKSDHRRAVVALAWRPWELIGAGRVEDGLAVLDDGGTWWEMAGRVERPMALMKQLLAEILSVVPMTFELVDAIVEEHRVALMVESHGSVDADTAYNNVYTFITDVDVDRQVIVAVREYVDTFHAATVLLPTVSRVIGARGGASALTQVLGNAQ